MPELYSESSDQKLLIVMRASVNDARDTVARTLALIEQSRTMLRESETCTGVLIERH